MTEEEKRLEDEEKYGPIAPRHVPLFFRRIRRDLRDQFKAACARRGFTMQQVIQALMVTYINDDGKVIIRPVITRKASNTRAT